MRKHHNKLYFGQYSHKATFRIPQINRLYPTSDFYIDRFLRNKNLHKSVLQTAHFIKTNRNKMKFRIQQRSCIVYANRDLILRAINLLWEHWTALDSIDTNSTTVYNDNTIVCKRLPLGKYQYQVHVKRKMYNNITANQRELLFNYLTQNSDNATVTNRNLKSWLSGAGAIHYDLSGYFYVKDEKALTPVYMISKHIVDKVVKFVKV